MKLTKEDIGIFESVVAEIVRQEVKPLRDEITKNTEITDRYLRRTEDWHQEQQILSAQLARMREILIEKGIASEEEFAVIDIS